MKESHHQNRDTVSVIDVAEGEKIGKTWFNCFRESKPRDTIKCLRSPEDNTLTLGTRAQIPTGYMVKTLRSQSTCDSNMPSDQMLSTF